MSDLNEKDHLPETADESQDVKEKLEQSSIAPPPVGVDNLVTKDGFRLHPQPTTDPLDPLNWSKFRKHSILGVVMYL